MLSYKDVPWNIPIPLRKDDFESYQGIWDEFNLVADLAQIGVFSLGFNDDIAVGYCDMQCNPDVNVPQRIGSGRSAFYNGVYLKGIGRTILAGNWRDEGDRYHNSGHLFPSSAAREYLISCYMEKINLSHTIVPCVGILAKYLTAAMHNAGTKTFGRSSSDAICPVDNRLSAITVKPDTFIRLSNLNWLIMNVQASREHRYVWKLFELIAAAFRIENANPDPVEIALGIATSFDRGIENLRRAFLAGVDWGSFHNNFTADGRFLDLETPTVTGFPFLVVKSGRGSSVPSGKLRFARGIFEFERQFLLFVSTLTNRLEFILAHDSYLHDLELDFIRCFLDALRMNGRKCNDPDFLQSLAHETVDHLGLDSNDAIRLERLALCQSEAAELARVDIKQINTEPNAIHDLWVPSFLLKYIEKPHGLALIYRECLEQADHCTDVDAWLESIDTAKRTTANASIGSGVLQ